MDNKKFLLAAGILTITAVIAFLFYIPSGLETEYAIRVSDFPKSIGGWASKDIKVSERDYSLMGTRNLILRNYFSKKGGTVNLYIIYSQDNRKVSDPPEIHLQGHGSTITYAKPLKISGRITATSLVIERMEHRELAAYWYKIGSLNTNSYLKQQFKAAFLRTIGRKKSVALIRVLTKIEGEDDQRATERIKLFCALMEPLLEKYIP
ncbi:EpsI family protein [bacterium]|nr:MAG: EpsI family protein [bacterium]